MKSWSVSSSPAKWQCDRFCFPLCFDTGKFDINFPDQLHPGGRSLLAFFINVPPVLLALALAHTTTHTSWPSVYAFHFLPTPHSLVFQYQMVRGERKPGRCEYRRHLKSLQHAVYYKKFGLSYVQPSQNLPPSWLLHLILSGNQNPKKGIRSKSNGHVYKDFDRRLSNNA